MDSYRKLFEYYKNLGQRTFGQISDDALFRWAPNEQSNSISVIVQHLSGNMNSRWTDFLTTDGEKEWRDREGEFISNFKDKSEMITAWEEGWACLFRALDGINEENKEQLVYIRSKGHTIDEAIQRQLAHYAYHVGQIVYLGRLLVGDSWKSLSIAKGDSERYNRDSFGDCRRKEHFTKEWNSVDQKEKKD